MMTRAQTSSLYQIKITLDESQPPIWRRIQVNGQTNLYKLHHILQDVMGWEDGHLHEFVIGGKKYSHPDAELEDSLDECKVSLAQLGLSENLKLIYLYDFEDSWKHDLLVEKIIPSENTASPICLAGQRACPPEDSGGIFDPEAFDLNAVNKALRQLK